MKAKAAHSHGWLVGILGLAVGITLMVGFPKLRAVAGVVLLIAFFHLVGLVVVLGSLYSFAPDRFGRLMERFRKKAPEEKGYDFGWSWGAMNGHWLAAAALVTIAFGLQLELPWLWPAWAVVALLGVSCFVGGLLLRTSKQTDFASLPLVDLLRSDQDLVLDAGCGGGRTTLALSKVLKNGRVVALDRFDAYYIDGGGRAMLERNLRIAGLTDRIQIEKGDLTALPFPDNHFDSAVSAHVIDHLKQHKRTGLAEIFRVLKPGGRFLMVVWVPGWATFSLANAFCLLLTSKAGWRKMAAAVGFSIRDEGTINGMWFAVLERPR
ncbi:MAG: class I SAM-dependent methyltransferase [Deltaproteobacteria bacterium]|nr:class I SAM-dependent methyltransferase [Deltaproteobacteria bacterium]